MGSLIKAKVVSRSILIENDPATGLPPVIMCNNKDYAVEFTFDSEWEGFDLKTARFVVTKDKATSHTDVVFSGNTCPVPMMSGVDLVYVGVFAGDLTSTCKTAIKCTKSILCDSTYPDPPPPDLYNQIIALFENVKGESAFIRFSYEPDGTNFTEFWSEGQSYIGFATAVTAPMNKEAYVWTRVGSGPQGEPGPPGPTGPPGTVPIIISDEDLEAGVSPLPTGTLYFVYE